MRFETGEMESVPILLAQALAGDDGWVVDITVADGTVHTGALLRADWETVTLGPPGLPGLAAVEQETVLAWDDVTLIRID